ncbi:MAG: PepSY-associated TM helix domain-containing protein [Ilumatobacter sp.]
MTIDHQPGAPIGEALAPQPQTPPDAGRRPDRSERTDAIAAARRSKRSPGRFTHRWSRLIHVYTSMVALLVVLFFAGTGILLNHPTWTFGTETTTETITGEFPFSTDLTFESGVVQGVDFLSISEFVRSEHGVVGEVDFFGTTANEGSIAYRNPGYAADLFFDLDDATYELRVEQQGWVAALSDLHQGSESGDAWRLLIDVTAVFLILISVTGLVMQFFLKKRRRSALVMVGVGVVIAGALMFNALR